MKYRFCLFAGIMGIAVISGVIDALSAPRTAAKEERTKVRELSSTESAGS